MKVGESSITDIKIRRLEKAASLLEEEILCSVITLNFFFCLIGSVPARFSW